MQPTTDSMQTRTAAAAPGATRLVWGLPLRLAHWTIVLCVAGSWATHYAGSAWMQWHARCGYAVLVLVAFRIAWGFVGTRHARFANFLRGPRLVLEYVRAGGRTPSVGHNPLGALSVLAMLALLLLQATTGLFANDDIAFSGPLAGWVSQTLSAQLTSVHHANSNALVAMIGLHVAAIAWYAWARGQPLVRAMLTGRRAASVVPPGEEIAGSRLLLAGALVVLLAGLLALAIRAAPEAVLSYY
jgi:cytochrome b